MRRWETSSDVINIYKEITKNRNVSQKIREKLFGPNSSIIHEDNLIKILKEIFPYYKLTSTQWKMIVEIGNRDTQEFINFDTFIIYFQNCERRDEMPRLK